MNRLRLKNEEERLIFIKATQDYLLNKDKSARQVAREYNLGRDRFTNYLKRNNYLRPKKDNSYNENFFEEINNEEKAYWLGFLYADGSISNLEVSSKNTVDLCLSDIDKDHLFKFKKSLNYKGDIKNKKIGKGRYKASRLAIYGEKIVNDLIYLGCTPRKTFTLEFPNENILPKSLQRHFIRGYFDGDGSVYLYQVKGCEKPKISISIIGTLNFLTAIQDIFIKEIGVRKVKIYDSRGDIFEYKKSWNEALKVLHFLYDDSNLYLSRKKKIFMDYCHLYE